MASKLRIQHEGVTFYVTFRGNARRALFVDDRERDRLAERFGGRNADFVLVLNANDSDGDGQDDRGQSPWGATDPDPDLASLAPLGFYCCPCPRHGWAEFPGAELASGSSRVKLWWDAGKQDAYSGPIMQYQHVYAEGLAPSPSPWADRFVWHWTETAYDTSLEHHEIWQRNHYATNRVTVLGVALMPDADGDGVVASALPGSPDAAVLASSPDRTWFAGTASNVLRKVLLRADVGSGVPGTLRLSVSGTARLRVWPGPSAADGPPILQLGFPDGNTFAHTFFARFTDREVYAEFLEPGAAELAFEFDGAPDNNRIRAEARQRIRVHNLRIVPDCDRDGEIGDADCHAASTNAVFRFWINDDHDVGDTAEAGGTDIPGQTESPDHANGYYVNGRRDLLDFFPVWLDLKDALIAFPPQSGMTFQLRSKGLRFVYTALTKDRAGKYLREECAVCGPAFNQNAHEALTFAPGDGQLWGPCVELSEAFLDQIRADGDKGVLLVECSSPLASLELEIVDQSGAPVAGRRLHLRASRVEDMYHRVNLRGGPAAVTAGAALPPSNGKHAVFVHGFNVDAQKARAWNAEMFKRLWQSGSNARFHGVTWKGDIGRINGLNFREDVVSAFAAAQHIRDYVVSSLSGEKIVMAHSLGNMVVSSAIADHGMGVGKYFMLNAAVPAEAYDESSWHSDDSGLNPMMHNDWSGYAGRTWSARWHELFLNNPNDDRALLTWKNRFSAVPSSILYNVYSSGDEVLELNNAAPALLTGAGGLFNLFPTAERYAWHKQEVFKGRDMVAGTTWAGWGFLRTAPESTYAQTLVYPGAAAANQADPAQLASQPVFRWNPPGMLTNSIPSALRKELLAKGIPALSGATGTMSVNIPYQSTDVRDIDMNSVARPNGWPRLPTEAPYGQRWKHSDLKDVAFFYNYNVYSDIVAKGDLE